MKPMPTSDVAIQVTAPKTSGARGFEKLKGGADATAKAGAPTIDRARGSERAQAANEVEKGISKTDAENDDSSFGAVVDRLDEGTAKPEAEAVVMEFTTPSSTLSQELAALFQGVVASGSQSEAVSQNAVKKAIEASTSGDDARALASVNVPEADVTPFVHSLPTRSETFALLDNGKIDLHARSNVAVADVPTEATAVSVELVKSNTGFDAPVDVKANYQTRFQDAVPLQSSIAAFVSARETNADVRNAVSGKADNVTTSQPVSAPTADGGYDQTLAFSNGQSTNSGADSRSSGERSSREVKSERSISPAKSLAGTLASVALSSNADVAPPYQQVRAAVTEAIFVTNATQRTDYVSMYADRAALSNPTLKTLEISLNPPDLGRVNVKMNLASRDLKLEIEASKASTAQMLSNDQSSLKRELLSDNFDLSSVLVSVTSAVSDTSSAAGLTGGDQQSLNGRASGNDSFASTTGGREERRQQQGAAFADAGTSRQPRDAEPDSSDRHVTGNGLYI